MTVTRLQTRVRRFVRRFRSFRVALLPDLKASGLLPGHVQKVTDLLEALRRRLWEEVAVDPALGPDSASTQADLEQRCIKTGAHMLMWKCPL